MQSGHKPNEINAYLQYVTKESIIFTHDWVDEIDMSSIADVLKKFGWVMIMDQFSEYIESGVRVFAHESNLTPTLDTVPSVTAPPPGIVATKTDPAKILCPHPSSRLSPRTCPWEHIVPEKWPSNPNMCTYFSADCHKSHYLLGMFRHMF